MIWFAISIVSLGFYVHTQKKNGFPYLWNVLNTLKTKINLYFVYIDFLLKERGVRPLPRSVGKCCFREVIAVGIVRTVRNNYIWCVADGTGFGLKA